VHEKIQLAVFFLLTCQVRKILGRPTAVYGNTLVFVHQHEQDIGGEPFNVSNTVYITFRAGTVWTIQVWKDTVS
jgi:hypothetical protein